MPQNKTTTSQLRFRSLIQRLLNYISTTFGIGNSVRIAHSIPRSENNPNKKRRFTTTWKLDSEQLEDG